jgi:uncharacterized membrane protein
MNTQIAPCLSRPVLGFLGLVGIAVAVAMAHRFGVIEAAVTKRAIGLDIGLMIMLMGNFLPKLRLFNSPGSDSVEGVAAEFAAGWILVLSGIVYISLFLFAPLGVARTVSSLVGMSAILAIIVNWWALKLGAFFTGRQTTGETATPGAATIEKRKLTVWLFTAFLYVLVSACVVSLLGDRSWGRELASWMVLAFAAVYAILYAVLEGRRTQ